MKKIVFIFLILLATSKYVFALEGNSTGPFDDYNQTNFEGGFHAGQIWFNNVAGKKSSSLSVFPYAYIDAGRYWHLSDPWMIGAKAGVGLDASNFNPPAVVDFNLLLTNKIAVPLETDIYGKSLFLFMSIEGGYAFTSLDYVGDITTGAAINSQNPFWAAPTVRLSLSVAGVEAAYQMLLPASAQYPTASALTLGLRLMAN